MLSAGIESVCWYDPTHPASICSRNEEIWERADKELQEEDEAPPPLPDKVQP